MNLPDDEEPDVVEGQKVFKFIQYLSRNYFNPYINIVLELVILMILRKFNLISNLQF